MEQPLSITEINELIKGQLESRFSEIVISGEVSNFKPHPSGHFYFSLKDEKAALSAVMFRGDNSKLKFIPQDGMKVIAFGRITVYPPRGNYQVLIHRMEPAGVGALQIAFEQLKKKLELLGYFEAARKKAIPRFPRKVALITASSGAAVRDMLNVLNRRFAGLHILLFPVKVQGQGAAEEVASAIEAVNRCFPEVDVMIVGRGGGSIEDLWAFNEEVVAHALYRSKIPTISAVGHEVDFTIADFVADLRAPTPSAAAELVVGNKWELVQHLDNLTRRMMVITKQLEFSLMKVDDLSQRLEHSLTQRLGLLQLKVERLQSRLTASSPMSRFAIVNQRYRHALLRLKTSLDRPLALRQHQYESLSTKLKLLSPMAIMERGYSIVRHAKTGKVIRKAADLRMGDSVLIELWKGKLKARL
jgi:exodeoxyribonuclease VII large subunit